MYFPVRTIIRTIHITKDSGRYHGTIQSGIEIHFIIQTTDTSDLYLPKLTVPAFFSLCHIPVKIIVRSLNRQVLGRTFHAYSRKCRTQHHFFPICRIKIETGYISSSYRFAILHNGSSIYFGRLEGFGKTSTEKDTLSTRPTVGETIPLYGA